MPTAEQPRWLEYVPLDELTPALKNPKLHSEAIGASLRRFGYVEAIALDERTGRLVAGHGRMDDLIAKRDAGEDPPEGVTVDPEGRWLVPVQRGWASSSDGEADAYLVASNQTTTAGGWNPVELNDLLASLDDLTGIGFTTDDAAAWQRLADDLSMLQVFHDEAVAGDELDADGLTVRPADDHDIYRVITKPGHHTAIYELLSSLDWVLDVTVSHQGRT